MIDQVLQASQFFKERLAPKHKRHNGHADSDHDDDQEHEDLDHLIFRENPAHQSDRP